MLEALFENPFLIIILIGIISSLFGKSKPAEEERQKRQQQQQQRQRTEQQPQQRAEPQPVRTQPIPQQQRPSPFESMQGELAQQPTMQEVTSSIEAELERRREAQEKRLQELQKRQMAAQAKADVLHVKTKVDASVQKDRKKRTDRALLPSYGSQIVDGIVLAEILGQPRAKNPHTSRRF